VKLLFQIYYTAVTFHTVGSQRGSGQSEVALQATTLGANGNNCERMREQAWARTCWARTCWARTCTGHEHVRREHVPGANMSGANMYRAPTCRAPTCTGREHVGRQLKGANLTPFFSKNTPKLPFLAEEARMNFFKFFFALSTIGSCPRLLGEHVQKISQNLTARIVR
jgi:hypothetical protein